MFLLMIIMHNGPMLNGQVFMKFEPIFTFFVLKVLEMQLNMIKSSQPIDNERRLTKQLVARFAS